MTLRTRLDDLAAGAPDPGVLDLERLRGRITRRRRGRLAAAGGAALLTVAAVGTAAATLLPNGDTPVTPPVATRTPVQHAYDFGSCGMPVRGQGPAPAAPLALVVDLADGAVDATAEDTIGTVTITNTSDASVHGTTGYGPEVFVADSDGTVVTEPGPEAAIGYPLTLAPGQSTTYRITAPLHRCSSRRPGSPAGFLAAGEYQLYVRWDLYREDSHLWLYSGPIEVEVR